MSFIRWLIRPRTLKKIFSAITLFVLMTLMFNKESPPNRINQISSDVIKHRHHAANKSLTCGYLVIILYKNKSNNLNAYKF